MNISLIIPFPTSRAPLKYFMFTGSVLSTRQDIGEEMFTGDVTLKLNKVLFVDDTVITAEN